MGNKASNSAWNDLEKDIERKSLCAQFNTGDILLYHPKPQFHSISGIFSYIFENLIMKVTNSAYSHASLIIRDPTFTTPPLKGLYVLESSYESFPDVETDEIKLGVELVHLDDVLYSFHGDIYWRKLECERNEDFYSKLAEAHSVAHNRPYDLIPSDWFCAALKLNSRKNQRVKTFWCSALVSYVYTQLGFLPQDTPWTLVSPKMLGTENAEDALKFKNCTLIDEYCIT